VQSGDERYGRKIGYLSTGGLSYLVVYNCRVLRGISQSCSPVQKPLRLASCLNTCEFIAPCFIGYLKRANRPALRSEAIGVQPLRRFDN
jgi:hypothetical protein